MRLTGACRMNSLRVPGAEFTDLRTIRTAGRVCAETPPPSRDQAITRSAGRNRTSAGLLLGPIVLVGRSYAGSEVRRRVCRRDSPCMADRRVGQVTLKSHPV